MQPWKLVSIDLAVRREGTFRNRQIAKSWRYSNCIIQWLYNLNLAKFVDAPRCTPRFKTPRNESLRLPSSVGNLVDYQCRGLSRIAPYQGFKKCIRTPWLREICANWGTARTVCKQKIHRNSNSRQYVATFWRPRTLGSWRVLTQPKRRNCAQTLIYLKNTLTPAASRKLKKSAFPSWHAKSKTDKKGKVKVKSLNNLNWPNQTKPNSIIISISLLISTTPFHFTPSQNIPTLHTRNSQHLNTFTAPWLPTTTTTSSCLLTSMSLPKISSTWRWTRRPNWRNLHT